MKATVMTVLETLLRIVPLSCKTGLYIIGTPDRTSPVLLTCNYHLTVTRVKRALQGIDCYLLVANSRGIPLVDRQFGKDYIDVTVRKTSD